MRQLTLFMLVFCGCLWVLPEAFADNHRLWIEQSLEDGGRLKKWMIQEGNATEEGFTCGALLEAAWQIAKRREVVTDETNLPPPSAQLYFTEELFETFRSNNNLPCENLLTELTWTQFGEIGRLNAGYTPFTEADVTEAKVEAEARTEETLRVEQAESAANGLVYHVPELPPTPNTGSAPTTATTTVSTSTPRRYAAVQMDGTIRRVISSGRAPLPSQAKIDDYVQEQKDKEKEARDKAKKEAAEAAEREAELERLEHEIEVQELRQELQELQAPEATPASYSGSQSWWDLNPLVTGESDTPYRSPQEHSEAFLRSYFRDIPEMVEVASCESTFRNIQSKLVDSNGEAEESFGFFQIHSPTWHDTALALGLPNYQTDAMQNALMARHMYELEGLHPWRNTKNCWRPKVRRLRR